MSIIDQKTFTIHGERHTSIEVFYADAKKVFNFPDYFGNNLDAFEECLIETVENDKNPVHIVWAHSFLAKKSLEKTFDDIVHIIIDTLHKYGKHGSSLTIK